MLHFRMSKTRSLHKIRHTQQKRKHTIKRSERADYLQLQGVKQEVPDNLSLTLEQKGEGGRDEIPYKHLIVVKRRFVIGIIRRHSTHRAPAIRDDGVPQ